MLTEMTEALLMLLEPARLVYVVVGVAVGLTVGLLPGLGGTVGMAVLLPLIYGMDPISAVGLLLGMAAVTTSSDSFPAVLIGVPGTSAAQATIMDGYPLAKQGQARRALGAAFGSAFVGGIIGALALLAIIPIARPLVLAFHSPELLMLALLGMSAVGVLAKGAPAAGLAAAALGLLLGTVGGAPAVPEYRYTFGSLYLFDGLSIAVLALGLFALPELIDLLRDNTRIARTAALQGRQIDGLKDVLRNKFLAFRSAVIGVVVGFIPGLGGSVVDWLAYAAAERTVKDNSFGKGDIRGVIAPEAAASAKDGGALIPTLLFGIPGSGMMAVLLGGFVLLGIQPGPSMVTTDLHVTLAIVWTMVIATAVSVTVCLVLTRWISKITLIPAEKYVPFIVIIIVLSVYQSNRNWGDVVAMFAVGLLGWVMKQCQVPRPPLLIGFVLAVPMERYLHLTMSSYGIGFLTRPGVIVLGVIVVLVIVAGFRSHLTRRRAAKSQVWV